MTVQRALELYPQFLRQWYERATGYSIELDEVWDIDFSQYPLLFSDDMKMWWEGNTNTTLLGVGNYRAVFDLKNGFVLKLPINRDGNTANEKEVAAWEEYENTPVGDFLAPIVAGGAEYVVMRKAQPLGKRMKASLAEEWDNRLLRFLAMYNRREHDIEDIDERENWGVIDNKLVLVDYPSA